MRVTYDTHGIPWVRHPASGPPSEDWEQQVAVTRLRALGWVVAAVPNGGKRGLVTAKKLKASGVLAGFPDLVCVRNGRVVFVEMKSRDGGKLSDAQRAVILSLLHAGAEVYVCEGWEAVIWICEHGSTRP